MLPFLCWLVSLAFMWPVPWMWAIVSCLCCVIKWFLYRVDAPFPLLLGEVLSVFRLFWCPLASCIVLGFLWALALW